MNQVFHDWKKYLQIWKRENLERTFGDLDWKWSYSMNPWVFHKYSHTDRDEEIIVSTSSCAWSTVRPNKLKQEFGAEKGYFKAMQGDRLAHALKSL